MNILITGVAGFIGSHTADAFLKDSNYNVVGLDSLTYAGNLKNIEDASKSKQFKFIKEDICNFDKIKKICEKEKIDCILNFAAETHVDNSIHNPRPFLRTNINGVLSILEVCKKLDIKLFHVSTDEVYGTKKKGSFDENSNFDPRNPYSATKAAAEHLIKSYENTYGTKFIIVRPSNNFGPRQHDEKFLPTIIKSIKANKAIPIYGNGKQIREWLYVKDNARAIKYILENGTLGEAYNITSNNEIENLSFVNMVYNAFGHDYEKKINFIKDRPGHDVRYSITNKKLVCLGFDKFTDLKFALKETINDKY